MSAWGMGIGWSEREDWLEAHGLGHSDDKGTITGNDGSQQAVYSCGLCGALVYSRHAHASWHLDPPAQSDETRTSPSAARPIAGDQ